MIIIGAGYGGVALANLLAKAGFRVDVYEKNSEIGGRVSVVKDGGFTFDIGPSWYLMPEVFEHYYSLFGESAKKRLDLRRLSPAYKVFFEDQQPITITSDMEVDSETFENVEKGAGLKLRNYVEESTGVYSTSVERFLYNNFDSPRSLLTGDLLRQTPRMAGKLFQSLDSFVGKRFKELRLQQILEYHSVFLGTSPFEAPAIYSLMSHLDFKSGVFYPARGMASMVDDLQQLGIEDGIKYHTDSAVASIRTKNGVAVGIQLNDGSEVDADVVVSNADLHFTETQLLPKADQTFPEDYWQKRQSGPSALTLSLGIKGSLPELLHHSLFFSNDWSKNFDSIYKTKKIPGSPSFYVCNPSKSDKSLAPANHENIFILVPMPAGIKLSSQEIDKLTGDIIGTLSKRINAKDLESRIVSRYTFGPDQFSSKYNAWQGNAFGGESHILKQSVMFRTRNKSKKLKNLYYVGAGTLPGIGLPMCLISAELAFKNIINVRHGRPLKASEIKETKKW